MITIFEEYNNIFEYEDIQKINVGDYIYYSTNGNKHTTMKVIDCHNDMLQVKIYFIGEVKSGEIVTTRLSYEDLQRFRNIRMEEGGEFRYATEKEIEDFILAEESDKYNL